MSEAGNQATSILLPSSNVAIYSKDHDTLEAARDIVNDWRFARVNLQVDEGDVATATQAYKEMTSPDLIIVQTETIDESLPEQLENLAAHCDEGTAAIVVGPVNDVDLYRKLIDMGISDYLVKPVETKFLADVIAKTLIEKIGVTGSRLIAFVGAKGGVGASSLAQASAWSIADILDQKAILLDTAGGWSTLSVGMGFEPSTTLAEAVKAAGNNDEDNLKRMLFEASDKLSVLASGGDVMLEPSVTPDEIEELLDMLMTKYPVVIADLSHGADNLEKAVLKRANQIMVVSTATLTSLRQARSLVQEIKEIRGGENEGIELLVNMQGLAPANEAAKGDIETAMEFPVSAIIPFDSKTFLGAESEGKKLASSKEGEDIVKNTLLPVIQKILAVSLDEETSELPKDGFMGGLMSKLKAK